MSVNVIRAMRAEWPDECFVSNCESGQLAVRVESSYFSDWTFVDLEAKVIEQFLEGNRCDFLFCAQQAHSDVAWAVPIEFKGGGISPTHAGHQLNGGAKLLASFPGWGRLVQFHPLLIHASGMNVHDHNKLKRQKVRFLDLLEPIRLARDRFELPGKLRKVSPQRI